MIKEDILYPNFYGEVEISTKIDSGFYILIFCCINYPSFVASMIITTYNLYLFNPDNDLYRYDNSIININMCINMLIKNMLNRKVSNILMQKYE